LVVVTKRARHNETVTGTFSYELEISNCSITTSLVAYNYCCVLIWTST